MRKSSDEQKSAFLVHLLRTSSKSGISKTTLALFRFLSKLKERVCINPICDMLAGAGALICKTTTDMAESKTKNEAKSFWSSKWDHVQVQVSLACKERESLACKEKERAWLASGKGFLKTCSDSQSQHRTTYFQFGAAKNNINWVWKMNMVKLLCPIRPYFSKGNFLNKFLRLPILSERRGVCACVPLAMPNLLF